MESVIQIFTIVKSFIFIDISMNTVLSPDQVQLIMAIKIFNMGIFLLVIAVILCLFEHIDISIKGKKSEKK